MGMLPSINSRFQKGEQQCAAEFFQEFCRVLGYRTSECQNDGFIPKHLDLSFLKTFFFNLRSEVLCLRCNNVSCNSTMETLLPLHLVKGCSLQQLIEAHSKPVQLDTPYMCYNCKDHTEAWKRLVIGKLPATICLQLLRFSSNGKKLQHIVKYDEMLKLCEIRISDDSRSTEISRVSYKLVAVMMHTSKGCTAFEAINQQAYLLFYERDVSADPVVEMSQGLSSLTPHTYTKQHPLRLDGQETIQIQQATPPSFYIMEPWCDVQSPAVCRTAKGWPGLQYTPICESEMEQAELLVTMGHTIPHHSRTQGWEVGDLSRLLPGQEEEGSWLSNFLLNKIFFTH
ncbi:hypothetical protein OS493_038360 [Desmophyllum pertusum]|uniref:USP domain-containing protein n=1 Tax=Desmophyllum pertusum TaxID=174260 RepID=A0A9X0D045_9CNID|nr:hypothetical protein OS493_038360 [Desmophyllum pertusum]